MEIRNNTDNTAYENFDNWKDPISEIKPREKRQIGKYKGIGITEKNGIDSVGYYLYRHHIGKCNQDIGNKAKIWYNAVV